MEQVKNIDIILSYNFLRGTMITLFTLYSCNVKAYDDYNDWCYLEAVCEICLTSL